jgi:hypothetical protein
MKIHDTDSLPVSGRDQEQFQEKLQVAVSKAFQELV